MRIYLVNPSDVSFGVGVIVPRWLYVLADCAAGHPKPLYDGGSIDAANFAPARWDLLPRGSYMWASVQTIRGCPKHCSFCSVWRTDGQLPRQRPTDAIVEEVVALRRQGYRFIALADDNFYPVTLHDLELAERRDDMQRYENLLSLRAERFELMERLSRISDDIIFFTQITMEAAEDEEFLRAMKSAHIKGALVGVETITDAGLKDMYKGLSLSGESGFRFDFKALSSDVCEYRDGNGEFRTGACRSVGPDSCQAVSGSFLGAAYAATAGARPRHGAGMMSIIPVDFFGACAIFL